MKDKLSLSFSEKEGLDQGLEFWEEQGQSAEDTKYTKLKRNREGKSQY